MMPSASEQIIAAAFERELVHISFENIAPLYLVTPQTKTTVKYGQIIASIREIGLVEPMVVARDRHDRQRYILLDGHLRLEALKDNGETLRIPG